MTRDLCFVLYNSLNWPTYAETNRTTIVVWIILVLSIVLFCQKYKLFQTKFASIVTGCHLSWWWGGVYWPGYFYGYSGEFFQVGIISAVWGSLFVTNRPICETKRDTRMVTRNPGFPIQNLPSDLRS